MCVTGNRELFKKRVVVCRMLLAHHGANSFNNVEVVDDLEEQFQRSGRDENGVF